MSISVFSQTLRYQSYMWQLRHLFEYLTKQTSNYRSVASTKFSSGIGHLAPWLRSKWKGQILYIKNKQSLC